MAFLPKLAAGMEITYQKSPAHGRASKKTHSVKKFVKNRK
ncbi:hypothetical protein HMPREF1586_01137 [Gardnerella vaginalis JCP8522]|nr:hypothetical protein HMPREF1586_01137 [Gardnerella vaginalis JCP8522]